MSNRPVEHQIRYGYFTSDHRQVMRLVVLGWSRKEIADALAVDENTISRWIIDILQRLRVAGPFCEQ